LDGGLRLLSARLRFVKSRQEFTARIADAVAKKQPGEWEIGRDWDHYFFRGVLPTLDEVISVNPI
jgi:predicted amidohydrolase YtcJ